MLIISVLSVISVISDSVTSGVAVILSYLKFGYALLLLELEVELGLGYDCIRGLGMRYCYSHAGDHAIPCHTVP